MDNQDKYCLAPLAMWSANPSGVRLYSQATNRISVASAQLFQLLRQAPLEHFRSLDEHVDELVRMRPNPDRLTDQSPTRHATDQVKSQLRRALDEMVRHGLLVSANELAGLWSEEASQDPSTPIRSICITTLNQPDALEACITTSSDNARNHGHQLEYIVLDDCRSSGREPDIVRRLNARIAPCSLAYVQSYHLDEYCRALAVQAGVDKRIVTFGLMPDERLRRTDGASKNALMLDAAGERYLQVDDDIQWRFGTPPPPLSGLRLYEGLEPMQTRYFRSRDAVVASANWKNIDFVGSHDAVLGRRLSALAAPALASDQLTFTGAVGQILPSLMSGEPAVVRATFTGIAGDPATEFPSYRTLLEDARAGLVATDGDYAALRLTREVIRVAPELTIVRPGWAMAFAMGCDATGLLPPFFPLGRSYERVFAALLSRCWPSAFCACLPVFVLHSPVGHRQFSSDALLRGVTSLRLPDVVAMLIVSAPPTTFGQAGDRMQRVGDYLVHLGNATPAEFEEVMFRAIFMHRSQQLNQHYRTLAKYSEQPRWWAEDLRSQITVLEQALDKREVGRLTDYPQLGDDGNDTTLQAVVRDFGQFLTAWPTLFEAAAVLKEKGLSLRNTSRLATSIES